MSNQINWEDNGFFCKPFNSVYDKSKGQELIWAGFPKIKESFVDVLKNSLLNEKSIIGLVISRYGGGKTHASYYFSQDNNIPEVEGTQVPPTQIVIKSPQNGSNSVNELYSKILESFKWRNIVKSVSNFIESNGDDSLEILESLTNSEDLARIIYLLGSDDEDISFEAQQALYGTKSAKSLRTLRVRRVVNSNQDRADVISLIIKLNSLDSTNQSRRTIIWIDELESLIYYASKEYRAFTQFLCELYDTSPKALTLMLSFSFSDPTDTQNIEIVLGKALLDRVEHQIIFDEANIDQSLLYLKELFTHYRGDNFSESDYFPFSLSSLKEVLETASEESGTPLTPRTINKWLLHTMEEAAKKEIVDLTDDAILEHLDFSNSL